MSASSKKKLRKEQEAVKMTEQQLSARKEAKKLNIYTAVFVAVLVLLLVVAVGVGIRNAIANSGIRERKTTALVVNDHQISNAELNYFYIDAVNQFASTYGNYAILFGLDITKPLDEQYVDEEAGLTWADDFLNSAKDNAKAVYAMADAAEAAGFSLTDEELQDVKTGVENLEGYAKLYGFPSADDYLKAVYGKGASKESFLEFSTRVSLANAFMADYTNSLNYEEEDLRAADAENPQAYSSFTYHTYNLSVSSFLTGGTVDEEGNTVYSDEEKAEAAKAAEITAKVLTNEDIDSVEALDAAIAGLPINSDSDVSSTANNDVLYASVNDNYSEWVTDADRVPGDKAYFPGTVTDSEGNETITGYYIVYFVGENDNTFPLVNVRHILLSFTGGTKDETTGQTVYSEEEKAAAKAEAEEVLALWQAGEATEDSFASLANEKSRDGDGTTGGLYENIIPGKMVANFNDWCFDASRKTGDTGIIETEYGYHVMYFSGNSDVNYRDHMIEDDLRSADSKGWYAEVVDAATVSEGSTRYIPTDLVLSRGN